MHKGKFFPKKPRWKYIIVAATIASLISFGLIKIFISLPKINVSDKSSFYATDLPKVAVLPFITPIVNWEYEYIANGVRDDLIFVLRKKHELIVIEGMSGDCEITDTPREKENVNTIFVHYLIAGAVKRVDNQFQVTLKVNSALSSSPDWVNQIVVSLENTPAMIENEINQLLVSLVPLLSKKTEKLCLARLPTGPFF